MYPLTCAQMYTGAHIVVCLPTISFNLFNPHYLIVLLSIFSFCHILFIGTNLSFYCLFSHLWGNIKSKIAYRIIMWQVVNQCQVSSSVRQRFFLGLMMVWFHFLWEGTNSFCSRDLHSMIACERVYKFKIKSNYVGDGDRMYLKLPKPKVTTK